MRKRLCLAAVLLGFAVSAAVPAQESDAEKAREHDQMLDRIVAAEAPYRNDAWRAAKIAQSPRRHELVKIPGVNGTLEGFVVYPDTRDNVPVVLMIPEDQGLNDWARDTADQIAAMGYIVVVPDLLSGLGPSGGGRSTFRDLRSVFAAFSTLPAKEPMLTAELNAWADYGKMRTQSNGKLAVAGFAWGGGRAWWFAAQRKDLSAALVFYDAAPPADALADVTAPVYGFYAMMDPRVTKSLSATLAAMASAGKKFEPVIYPGSEHMFVRLGEEPGNTNPANIEARTRSLSRVQEILKCM